MVTIGGRYVFFFNDTATTEIYTLSLHDALPISYTMDALGDAKDTAMARLVSIPVSFAVEAVKQGELLPGVQAAPSDPAKAQNWLDLLVASGENIALIDNLT